MTWPDPDLIARARARSDLIAVTILVAVSLAVRLRHLFRPLHGDELITFSNMVLGRDFAGVIFGPFDSNSHLLNSLIMKTVYLVAGDNPALMRLPSLVFILLAIVLVYLIGAREFGRTTAFAAALLLSLHPATVLFSVWGRGYAGMILFTLISSSLFLQVLRSFSWRRLLWAAITGFLAGTFHLFAVNVLIAEMLIVVLAIVWPEKGSTEILSDRSARLGPAMLGPMGASAMLIAVYLPAIRQSSEAGSSFSFQTSFPAALMNFMGGFAYRTDLDLCSVLLLTLALTGFLGLERNRTLKLFWGLLFLSPISLYVLSFFAPVFTLHPRFFSFLLPFYCLLVVLGLTRIARLFCVRVTDRSRAALVIRGAVCLGVILVGVTFVGRIDVPKMKAQTRAQKAVGDYVDSHPETQFLTNDTGFVRVRLRQEKNMDRIRPALGIIAINQDLEQHPDGAVAYIYVPQKRYTEADLIHYRGAVSPEVKYQRDERLRSYLQGNATLELDLAPMLQIYTLRP
jgi:hypothetical protein